MKSKVAIIPCDSYEEDQVFKAIEKGIELLGGLEAFISHEERLLLKPNLLNRAEVEKAVTTHPAVFAGVARLLREKGYEKLTYGDSPGYPGGAEKTAESCGIKAVADEYKIPIGDFTRSTTVEYQRSNINRRFEICRGVLEADGIINICKMKTHQLERITGGVKNLFGAVCGAHKGAAHVKYPDAESFAQMLVDLNLMLPAKLHVMDGIVAMEGNGPASGNPVKMNVIIISSDPVAMDASFCRLVNLDPATIPTVYYGGIFGLGKWKEEDIEMLGVDDLADYINPDFDISREKVFIGKWSFLDRLKVIGRKPVILSSKCIKCGACIEACPVEGKAVDFPEGKKGKVAPVYNYKKCIRCYCCQELCPAKAIIVKRKLL